MAAGIPTGIFNDILAIVKKDFTNHGKKLIECLRNTMRAAGQVGLVSKMGKYFFLLSSQNLDRELAILRANITDDLGKVERDRPGLFNTIVGCINPQAIINIFVKVLKVLVRGKMYKLLSILSGANSFSDSLESITIPTIAKLMAPFVLAKLIKILSEAMEVGSFEQYIQSSQWKNFGASVLDIIVNILKKIFNVATQN